MSRDAQATSHVDRDEAMNSAMRLLYDEARKVDLRIREFGLDTPIQDRFRGDALEAFWKRARSLSGKRIPPLTTNGFFRVMEYFHGWWSKLLLLGIIVGILGGVIQHFTLIDNPVGAFALLAGLIAVCFIIVWLFVGLLGAIVYRIVDMAMISVHGLPHDVSTFGDLAKLICGERGGWCKHCGYDLTGLVDTRCPECGKDFNRSSDPARAAHRRESA